jgi:hypothetical protein
MILVAQPAHTNADIQMASVEANCVNGPPDPARPIAPPMKHSDMARITRISGRGRSNHLNIDISFNHTGQCTA